MGYGESTISKFQYAKQLAASLGYLLLAQRDAVGMIAFELTGMLERCQPGNETSLARVIERILPSIHRRSLIVLISDCFDQVQVFTDALKRFRHARHEVLLMQVVAPEEEDFPFRHPTQFRSLERSNHRLLVDPHRFRKLYLEQYRKFGEKLSRSAGGLGIDLVKMTTAEPYQAALGAFLDARTRSRGKRS